MPFTKAQSALKKVLPGEAFELVHRIATAVYYANQGVLDWLYYNIPRRDNEKRLMIRTMREVKPYTMVGRGGLIATYKAVRDIEDRNIEGCLVECGVARGGSSALMLFASLLGGSRLQEGRELWLFDSYEGLPRSTPEDGYLSPPKSEDRASCDLAEGYCLGTLKEVEDLLFDTFGFSAAVFTASTSSGFMVCMSSTRTPIPRRRNVIAACVAL